MHALGAAVLILLAMAVTGYAIVAYGFLPVGQLVHPDMRASFEAHRAGVYTHVFAAACALGLGPWQFSTQLRARRAALHRWMGRLYLGMGVLIGGLSGLYLAFHAFGGIVARLGFGALALLWLYTGWRAYRAIRAGDRTAHRTWMVRNFALTFAAVMLRLWVPLSVIAGVPLEQAYPGIAWLCWVPNLIVAERLIKE